MIDSYLRSQSELDDRAIHLLFSANRWEAAESMIKELETGTTIICDRYAFSGIAFSAAKALPPPPSSSLSSPDTNSTNPSKSISTSTLSYEWCRAPDTGLPAPDLVIFLDVSEAVAQARGGYGQERYEKADMQRRVRAVFQRIAIEFPPVDVGRRAQGELEGGLRWINIDAGQDMDKVGADIWNCVEALVGGVGTPLGRLWSDAILNPPGLL